MGTISGNGRAVQQLQAQGGVASVPAAGEGAGAAPLHSSFWALLCSGGS